MADRTVRVRVDADVSPYAAGLRRATQDTRTFAQQAQDAGRKAERGFTDATRGTKAFDDSVKASGRTIEQDAQRNVAAAAKKRQALQGLEAQYRQIAAAAQKGSAEEVAASRLAESAAKRLGTAHKAAAAEARSTGSGIQGVANNVRGALDKMVASGVGSGTVLGQAFSAIKGSASTMSLGVAAGVGAAGLAIGKFVTDGVGKFVRMAAEIRGFQRTTGASAEDASKLTYALRFLGADVDGVSTQFARFGRNIIDKPKLFNDLGVEIARTKGGAVDMVGTFFNVADVFQKAGGAAERDAIALALFGKRGTELIPILGKTREELQTLFGAAERHGLIFSQEDLDNAKAYSLATREMGLALQGLEISAGKRAVPALTQMARETVKVIDLVNAATDTNSRWGHSFLEATRGVPGIGILSNALLKGEESTKDYAIAAEKLSKAMGGLSPFMDELLKANPELIDDNKKLGEQTAKLSEQYRQWGSAIGLTAEQMFDFANRNDETAQRIVKSVEQTRSAFEGEFDVIRGFAAAAKEHETATEGVTAAQEKLRDAQQALSDLRARQAGDDKTTIADSQQLAAAQDKVAEAQRGVVDAQKRLVESSPEVFFRKQVEEADRFVTSIQEVARRGLDPNFVAKLLEAGPAQSGPILQAMLADHSGTILRMANETQTKINQISAATVEAQRVTQRAISTTNLQVAGEFQTAMDILGAKAKLGGHATVEQLAAELGIGVERVRQVTTDYVITTDESLAPMGPTGFRHGEAAGSQTAAGIRSQVPANVAEALGLHTAVDTTLNPAMGDMGWRTGEAAGSQTAAGIRSQVPANVGEALGLSSSVDSAWNPALPAIGEHTGWETAGRLVQQIAARRSDAHTAAADYARAIAAGVNPVLAAIGARLVDVGAIGQAIGDVFAFAEGGHLPDSAKFQPAGAVSLVEWAEPQTRGEWFFPESKGEKNVPLAKQMLEGWGFDVVPRETFAIGGKRAGVNADFLSRLDRWADATPGGLSITSGFRSYAEQAELYRRYKAGTGNLAAPPGSSMHEKGLAVDHAPYSRALVQAALAFAIGHPVAGELWHAEPGGGVAGGTAPVIPHVELALPPDFSPWGTMLGYTGDRASWWLHDQAQAWVNAKEAEMAADAAAANAAGGGGSGFSGTGNPDRDWIIQHESEGNVNARNPSSGAFGLGQLNPSSGTLQEYAARFGYDPHTTDRQQQLNMMDAYVHDRYGNYANARRFWEAHGWYAEGGFHYPTGDPVATMDQPGWYGLRPGSNLIWNGTGGTEPVYASGGGGGPVSAELSDRQIDRLGDAVGAAVASAVGQVDFGHGHSIVIDKRQLGQATGDALRSEAKALS